MAKKDFSFNPPINTVLADSKGNATPVWAQWFGNTFQTPTRDKPWLPVLTGLSTTGAYSVKGEWNRIGPIVFWSVTVTPSSGSTTASGGSLTTFPFNSIFGESTAFNASTRASLGSALTDSVVSVPNWTAITAIVKIRGWAQVGGGE